MVDKYNYRVIWSDEDDEFVGLCDEFPGLSWLSELRDDALTGISKLVADVIKDMQAHDEPTS